MVEVYFLCYFQCDLFGGGVNISGIEYNTIVSTIDQCELIENKKIYFEGEKIARLLEKNSLLPIFLLPIIPKMNVIPLTDRY